MTGEVAVKTVTETYINETDELVHIGVNGETISATRASEKKSVKRQQTVIK